MDGNESVPQVNHNLYNMGPEGRLEWDRQMTAFAAAALRITGSDAGMFAWLVLESKKGSIVNEVINRGIMGGDISLPVFDLLNCKVEFSACAQDATRSYLLTDRGAFSPDNKARPVVDAGRVALFEELRDIVTKYMPELGRRLAVNPPGGPQSPAF